MSVVFVGLSHMGVVASIGWASHSPGVVGIDPDGERVAALSRGELPVGEPGLADGLRAAGEGIRFTSDAAAIDQASLLFISLDVQTDEHNRCQLDELNLRIELILPRLREGVVVVLMSQVPVGFTRALRARITAARPGLRCALVYMVETLVIGEALARFLHPERIILGLVESEQPMPAALADALAPYDCPVLPMSYESAELSKMAINLYLSCSVTFANTLSDLCETLGANVHEINGALRLDRRIGPRAYLQPGLGIAGGNLERDLASLQALAAEGQLAVPLIDTIVSCNAQRGEWILRTLERELFATQARPRIALWGLCYKPGSASLKNAPSVRLIEALAGRAEIVAHDPLIDALPDFPEVQMAPDADAALAQADCLVLLTAWPEYAQVEAAQIAARLRGSLVIDSVGGLGQSEVPDALRLIRMGVG